MISRFKASLGYFKRMRDEVIYHTKNEDVFIKQYVEENHQRELLEEHKEFSARQV